MSFFGDKRWGPLVSQWVSLSLPFLFPWWAYPSLPTPPHSFCFGGCKSHSSLFIPPFSKAVFTASEKHSCFWKAHCTRTAHVSPPSHVTALHISSWCSWHVYCVLQQACLTLIFHLYPYIVLLLPVHDFFKLFRKNLINLLFLGNFTKLKREYISMVILCHRGNPAFTKKSKHKNGMI